MTSSLKALLTVVCLLSAQANAQVTFKHIVILVQENRTPDNLFSSCGIKGADTVFPSGPPASLGADGPPHIHGTFLDEARYKKYPSTALTYVPASEIQPYCQMAETYGFANRMFQTNQGPSTPAHQFLFSGTSQPSAGSPYFESEVIPLGCIKDYLVAYFDTTTQSERTKGSACLNPPTLSDLLEAAGLSWHYYAQDGLWNSPTAISHICVGPNAAGTECTGEDWIANVTTTPSKVLTDLSDGKLANVTWVIPTGANSDHPGDGTGGGPAWVSSIVNEIGQSAFWQDTAIILTWDDWGGFWDHVPPLANNTGWCTGYCYGFRVPMLVISAYTRPMIDNNVHDFGSVVHFVEHNFGLGSLHVADAYADDLVTAGYFSLSQPQPFSPIQAPPVTRAALDDTSEPDDY